MTLPGRAVPAPARHLGVRSPGAAEDPVRDTFLAALRSPAPSGDSYAQHAAWLRGIARNPFLADCCRERAAPDRVSADALLVAERVWADEFLRGGDGYDTLEAVPAYLGRLAGD